MANHVDFIDDYSGYKIFEESMKDAGGEKQPKKASGSGCSAWGAIIVIVLAVLLIFEPCRKSSSESYSFGYCSSYSSSRNSLSGTAPVITTTPLHTR